jgi:hypothetical protein
MEIKDLFKGEINLSDLKMILFEDGKNCEYEIDYSNDNYDPELTIDLEIDLFKE